MIKCSEIEQGKVVTDMMVACLIFNQSEISKDSIKQILISEFKWNEYEFFETEDKLILYLWNVVKMDIWQIVLLLEFSQVRVGYGFGQYKNVAKEEAENKLFNRNMEG